MHTRQAALCGQPAGMQTVPFHQKNKRKKKFAERNVAKDGDQFSVFGQKEEEIFWTRSAKTKTSVFNKIK